MKLGLVWLTLTQDGGFERFFEHVKRCFDWEVHASAALLVLVLTQSGCVDWVAVLPNDAEKLSETEQSAVIHQPDGRLAHLPSDYNVEVELKTGAVYDFEPPVSIDRDYGGDALIFRGANRTVRVVRGDITSLKAGGQLNSGATAAACVL